MGTPFRHFKLASIGLQIFRSSLAILALSPYGLFSQEESDIEETTKQETVERAKFYRSPEERREAGLGTPLTEWLTFYGLLEAEYEYSKLRHRDGTSFSEDFDTEVIQIGLEAEFTEWLLAEFVLEVEYDRKLRTFVDEGLIALEFDTWAIKAGVQNLDFGEYYSHFVTGPLLEFGETRRWTLTGERELGESMDFLAYTFERENEITGSELGWGVAMEWASEDESVRIGTGYMSDVRQSDDFFGEEDYANPTPVPAWSMFALVGFESFELTAEVLAATEHFVVEEERFRPNAYNLELAYFLNYDFQIAGRVEYSNELLDEPEWQSGVAITWLLGKQLLLSVDYLYGTYKTPIEIEEDEEYPNYRNLIAVQVGFEF